MDSFLFIIYNYCSIYWTTLCLPPASFRRSRTLSAHWRSTSSTPPRTPSTYWRSTPVSIALFVKISLGRACNNNTLTFLCWCEMTILSANLFISQTFALSLTDNTFVVLKTPCCVSWDIQGQSLSCGSKAFSCTTLLSGLGACICLAFFSSLHLRLAPFLGSLIVLQFHNWSSKFWKSTVLDPANHLVESVSFAILHCQSYLRECISRRGLLHYSEGTVFVLR